MEILAGTAYANKTMTFPAEITLLIRTIQMCEHFCPANKPPHLQVEGTDLHTTTGQPFCHSHVQALFVTILNEKLSYLHLYL